jgi:uncharacterized ferritin-like protein (DUF455 family)
MQQAKPVATLPTPPRDGLFAVALTCLRERDPEAKLRATRQAAADWRAGRLVVDETCPVDPLPEPGRPARPELVHPRDLTKRSARASKSGGKGQAALIHAVAHIEFNAINLAWDAVQRFRGLPRAYCDDWVRVADEEAMHFGLMRDRLRALGYDYSDFPAHDGLWSMAQRTAADPLERMALVPRVMEARGLDVTPGMMVRFREAGDEETAACLEVILRDEVGHVAAGTRWFRYLCAARGLDPETRYFELLSAYLGASIRCPLNLDHRRQAGFAETELERLQALCQRPAPA